MGKTGPYQFSDSGLTPNFIPNNRFQAKKQIKRTDFGMFLDRYDHKQRADWDDFV